MAYENYRFVAWANRTPITGERLGQMSTNIEQVREANDDKPQGLLKITNEILTAANGNITNNNIITVSSLSGTNVVSVSPNRFFRLTVAFPGIRLLSRGGENSVYTLTVCSGSTATNDSAIAAWDFTPPSYNYYANSTSPSLTIKTTASADKTVFGSGTYSFVTSSGVNGIINTAYCVGIRRTPGANSNFTPTYSLNVSSKPGFQFYVEDIGGAITA
jgi:hypothetical protein